MVEADCGPHRTVLGFQGGVPPVARTVETRKCLSSALAENLVAACPEEAAIVGLSSGAVCAAVLRAALQTEQVRCI
jgi:hypothetical protein